MKGPVQITGWCAAYKGHQCHWFHTYVQPNSEPSLPNTLSCDLMMPRDREITSPLAVPVFSQASFCVLVAYRTEGQKQGCPSVIFTGRTSEIWNSTIPSCRQYLTWNGGWRETASEIPYKELQFASLCTLNTAPNGENSPVFTYFNEDLGL